MCKLGWSISGILLLIVAGMAYKFIIGGAVAPGGDGRQVLLLEAAERDLVLSEMRAFLQSVQIIIQAISDENMERIAQAARQVGANARQQVPASLVGKLPLSFKQLGSDTHRQFDMLALDAEQLGDPAHSLQQLAALMQNCTACHGSYRLDTSAATGG